MRSSYRKVVESTSSVARQAEDAATDAAADAYTWRSDDAFVGEDDRKDLPPVPMPALETTRDLVLVRHGQSTWNQAARIQGSSNVSRLTLKGATQAEAARDRLAGDHFDVLYSSPLQRSAQTAEIIWTGRQGEPIFLPSLREVDLYSFQGIPCCYSTFDGDIRCIRGCSKLKAKPGTARNLRSGSKIRLPLK